MLINYIYVLDRLPHRLGFLKFHTLLFIFYVLYFEKCASQEVNAVSYDYCIVGAGPAGLQMAYFLHQSRLNYIVFEKSDKPGHFFEKFPRHRKLISINKRYTGRINKEFNLRHDWNSLITNDYSHLFTNYSNHYFPSADSLLRYLKDFSEKFNLNVAYNVEIHGISYTRTRRIEPCRYSMKDQNDKEYCCESLFIATGLSKPVLPKFSGSQYVDTYDNVSTDPKDYEGKSVLIIGRGNSGLELASSIYGYSNYVHLVGRNKIRFSWDTHYVGDIRGINNEVVDAYMLKSLDGFLEFDVQNMEVTRRLSDGKLIITLTSSKTGQKINPELSPTRHGYDRIVACMGFVWDSSIFGQEMLSQLQSGSKLPKVPPSKYPEIGDDYQSPYYDGLYFIGTLAHSLDYKKSAGGFIHGFRYAIRALHRLLQWRNHKQEWPNATFDLENLITQLLKRANEASGIYQMFGHLADVAIVNRDTSTFVYLEEFPVRLLHSLPQNTGIEFDLLNSYIFVLTLEYGKNFSLPNFDRFSHSRAVINVSQAHLSNFLHPVVYFFDGRLPESSSVMEDPADDFVPGADATHHILEDFTTTFDLPLVHRAPLRRFIESKIGQDLKTYLAESCAARILANCKDIPHSCHRYLNTKNSVLNQHDYSSGSF